MALKKIKKEKISPKDILKEKRSYCDRIHDSLEEQQVTFFRPIEEGGTLNIDKDYLSLPQNIIDISTKELGE